MPNLSIGAIAPVSFSFESKAIRTTVDGGEIWFVLKDIALALGYSSSSVEQIGNLIKNIPAEWTDLKPIKVSNRHQQMYCVSEPGLYFFLGRSDKPKALPFQKWVCGEVLPAIRKTGGYISHESAVRNYLSNKEFVMYFVDGTDRVEIKLRERKSPYDGLAKAIADPSNIGLTDEVIEEIGQACMKALAHRAKNRVLWGQSLKKRLAEIDPEYRKRLL